MDVSEERVSHREDCRTGFKAPVIDACHNGGLVQYMKYKAVNRSWLVLNAYRFIDYRLWLYSEGLQLPRRLFVCWKHWLAHQIKMTAENTTIKSRIKNLLRSPSIKLRRSKAGSHKENLSNKVQCTTVWHEACMESVSAVVFKCVLTG